MDQDHQALLIALCSIRQNGGKWTFPSTQAKQESMQDVKEIRRQMDEFLEVSS